MVRNWGPVSKNPQPSQTDSKVQSSQVGRVQWRMIEQVEDGVKMLSEADPEAKNALYAALGIRLTYDPERNRVTVEAQPSLRALGRVGGPDYAKPDWRIQPWGQER
jgi:hypothetical protein